MTIWNTHQEFDIFRRRINTVEPNSNKIFVDNRHHDVAYSELFDVGKRMSTNTAVQSPTPPKPQVYTFSHAVLAIILVILTLVLITVWFVFRAKSSNRRKNFAQTKRARSDRDIVARFYNAKRCLNQGFSVNSALLDETEKYPGLTRQMRRNESSRNVRTSRRSSRLQVTMDTPSVPIGQPQTVQPTDGSEYPKKLQTEHTTSKQAACRLEDSSGTTTTGNRRRSGMNFLILRARSRSEDRSDALYRRRSSIQSAQKEHLWGDSLRKYSVRPDRFSVTQPLGLPVRRVLTSNLRYSLGDNEDDWINLGLSLYGRGRIAFSLSYICTVGLLEVTVNRLAGVHHLEEVDNQLPSQSQTAFVVGLRLKSIQRQITFAKSPPFTATQFTHSTLASLNPTFDQSFTFRLQSQDIDTTELVFTIHKTVFQSFTPLDMLEYQRNAPGPSTSNTESRRPSVKFHQRAETQCLGVVHYKLNKNDLLNRPESLRELWRDIERVTDFDETSSDEAKECCPSQSASLRRTGSDHLSRIIREPTPNIPKPLTRTKPAVQLSIYYDFGKSHLFIRLEDTRNINLRRKDAYIFARTVLYKGDKIFASARSQSIKLYDPTASFDHSSNETQCCKQFPNDIFQFPIDVTRILEGMTLGVTLYLCTRSRFGLSHLVGQCSVGASGFTGGSGNVHWEKLMQAIKTIKNAGSIEPTPSCTHWHELSQAFY